jgi:hypothetical protein
MELVGTAVSNSKHGKGVITSASENVVTVRFDGGDEQTVSYSADTVYEFLRFEDPAIQHEMDVRREKAVAALEAEKQAELVSQVAKTAQVARYSGFQEKLKKKRAEKVMAGGAVVGDVLTEDQVRSLWHVSFIGGIRVSRSPKVIVLVELAENANTKDGPRADGFYHYGAQAKNPSNNELLLRSKELGYQVVVLLHDGVRRYQYYGRAEVIDVVDRGSTPWEFRLKLLDL